MRRRELKPLLTHLTSVALGGALAACLSGAALAHGEAGHEADVSAKAGGGVRVKIADADLIDIDERELNFKSDALGDRIVAIDFVYTTCTTVCPVLSAVFAEVQESLGDRLGRDARLLSITIDPSRDTPAVLRSYSENFGPSDGWLFLTGEKSEVDRVLLGLGVYTPDITSHPPTVLIGDAARNQWVRLYGFVSPAEIEARIGEFLEARGAVPAIGTEKVEN